LHSAKDVGEPLHLLHAVERANERQKQVLVDRVTERFGNDLQGRRFAVWGLAFKPDTDDLREAPSRVIIANLLSCGASVVAYDPVAMDQARHVFEGVARLDFAASANEALEGADALLIVTEWKAFRSPDFTCMRTLLRQPVIFDGRNLFDPALMRDAGFEYFSIGRRRNPPLQAAARPVALARAA
jgi:UDPglucose 6-dehydrogenase